MTILIFDCIVLFFYPTRLEEGKLAVEQSLSLATAQLAVVPSALVSLYFSLSFLCVYTYSLLLPVFQVSTRIAD